MMFSPSAVPVATGPQCAVTTGVISAEIADALTQWAADESVALAHLEVSAFHRAALLQSQPTVIVAGTAGTDAAFRETLRSIKADARLQTVPTIVVCPADDLAAWMALGADECLTETMTAGEIQARLSAAVRRSRRDIQVNPSTRLVGSDAITQAIAERLEQHVPFAACYADLDHFKEFNDRYGYAKGDDIIRTVAALLVEVVEETAGADGFVGHIGGDDFLFLVPLSSVAATCETLVRRADEILPKRYSAPDRKAGYFFGKDRRGRLDRVPLMTLSIGVVTNERRRFTHAAQVSELATEMKTYAKTLPGSVWAMDRRSDGDSANPPEEKHL
ncbi:MAG: diguanylate cyclase [Gemmatimonadaceae bacterium]|nr:diguanylate cyclase [Gemmatimonadaceae bacterium]